MPTSMLYEIFCVTDLHNKFINKNTLIEFLFYSTIYKYKLQINVCLQNAPILLEVISP